MPLPKLTNRWAVLALLFFVRSAMSIQFQSIPPIAPLVVNELALSFAQVGVLMGLFMLPGAFVALPGGLLGRHLGDRMVVVIGLVLMVLGSEMLAASSSFGLAFAGRLVGGIGAVLVTVQSTKIVTDWFAGKELATAMALLLSSWHIGTGVALASLGGIATAVSWRAALHATSVFTVLALGLFFACYGDASEKGARPSDTPLLWTISRRELVLISTVGMVWMIWNVGFIVFVSFAPLLFVDRGMAIAQAGFVTSLPSWLSLVSVPLGGYLIDRTGKANLLIGSAILGSGLIVCLLPFGPILSLIILMAVVRGPCAGGVNALPGEVLRQESRSTGMGVYYTIFYLGMATLPPVAGHLQDLAGNPGAPVIFAGVLTLLTILPLVVFRVLQRCWSRAEDTGIYFSS